MPDRGRRVSIIEEVSLEGSNRGPAGAGGAGHGMAPTDICNPDYFHKVVDCQWACPAHTPVPEYIRLIAAGRYTDAFHMILDLCAPNESGSG